MRSAVWIRDGVRETKNLIVVAVVILQHAIDKSLVALTRNIDRFRVDNLLVLAQLPDEFLNAVLVKKRLFFGWIDPLIGQPDFEAGIQERQLAQSSRQTLELEFRRDGEDGRIGQKGNQRTGVFFVFDFSNNTDLLGGVASFEGHVVDLAIACD